MDKPAQVHIVFYSGPEWNTPVGVFYDKDKATAFANEKNADKTGDIYDALSEYVVSSHAVKD